MYLSRCRFVLLYYPKPMLSAMVTLVWWSSLKDGILKIQTYEILFLTKSLAMSAKRLGMDQTGACACGCACAFAGASFMFRIQHSITTKPKTTILVCLHKSISAYSVRPGL